MQRPKKCQTCRACYLGDGYQGSCIAECFFKAERAIARELKKKNTQVKPVNKYGFEEEYVEPKNPIKEKNSQWAKSDPRKEMTKEQKIQAKRIMRKHHLTEAVWTGKQYRAVRG